MRLSGVLSVTNLLLTVYFIPLFFITSYSQMPRLSARASIK